jgi:antitoxin (DNA-binding transcriptional repressor) of toxin-antitoxin stability system
MSRLCGTSQFCRVANRNDAAKAAQPVAKFVPLAPVVQKKHLGLPRGTFAIPDDLDAPLPTAIIVTFEAR